jgi:hypothetical protein
MKSLSLSSRPMRSMTKSDPLLLSGTTGTAGLSVLSITGAGMDEWLGALLTLLKAVKAEEFWLLRTVVNAAIS